MDPSKSKMRREPATYDAKMVKVLGNVLNMYIKDEVREFITGRMRLYLIIVAISG